MQIFCCTMHPGGTTTRPSHADAAVIQDIVWAHAPASLHLEHVTAVPAQDGIRLVFFLRQATDDPIPQIEALLAGLPQ
jgi:hypothetical protein